MKDRLNYSSFGKKPWGNETFTMKMAGHMFHLEGLSANQHNHLVSRFSQAQSDLAGSSFVRIRVLQVKLDDLQKLEPLQQNEVVRTRPTVERVIIEGRQLYGDLSLKGPCSGKIWVHQDSKVPTQIALENFLRLALAYRMLLSGGLLLHAAAVLAGDEADLFLGRSNFGKTTISRALQKEGATVLSDDMVALQILEEGIFVESIPLAGELDTWSNLHQKFPVRSMSWLAKGEVNEFSTALTTARATSRIMVCAPWVNASPCFTDLLMERSARLSEAVKLRTLIFNPQSGIGSFIEKSLKGHDG